MFENKWYDRDSSLYFLQYKNIYMVTGVSIAWTMSTFTLKALSAVAVLKSKISIPPNQIPHTLNEDNVQTHERRIGNNGEVKRC